MLIPNSAFFALHRGCGVSYELLSASILFGAIGGAIGVLALGAGDRNADFPTAPSVVTANTAIAVPPSNGEATSAAAQSYNGLEGGRKTSHSLKSGQRGYQGRYRLRR